MIQLALVFHANQATTPFTAVAARASYRPLWDVLRAHPAVRCTLHLSGTLLHSLLWLDPDALAPVRAGLAGGQFELLGSTYAQNVPYATDDADNALQIAEHRALLREVFGVDPTTFWNSERCWRQSLAPVIADGGFRATLLEDHALRAAGATDLHRVYATAAAGRRLALIPDTEPVKGFVNWAIWSGECEPLLAYLRGVAAAHPDGAVVTYAEDAEAVGLWGYERGFLPQADWARLDALLARLEQEPDVAFARLGDLPAPSAELATVPDSQAAWMTAALQNPAAPYHEDGYRDWFDFNARAPKNAHYRALYAEIRAELDRVRAATQGFEPGHPAARLLEQAGLALCAAQYEFGCVGIGRIGSRFWEQARSAFVVAHAARLAAVPAPLPESAAPHPSVRALDLVPLVLDLDRDSVSEPVLASARQLIVLGPQSGRLLYWFDLAHGVEHVGNEIAFPFAPYAGETGYPVPPAVRRRWLPDPETGHDLAEFDGLREEREAPGPWGVWVPETVWRGDSAGSDGAPRAVFYRRPADPGETAVMPAVRQRALNETATLGRRRVLWPGGQRAWEYALDGAGVRFRVEIPGALRAVKRVTLGDAGPVAEYELTNLAERPVHLTWEVESELCPDYRAALDAGRAALRYWTRSSERRHGRWRATERPNRKTRGVVNTRTGHAVVLAYEPEPASVQGAESLFALALVLGWEWSLAPQETARLRLAFAGEKH